MNSNLKRNFPISRRRYLSISQYLCQTRCCWNIYIGASCSPSEVDIYRALFHEFRHVFYWTYEEIPSINPNIVVHEIKMYPDTKLIRHCLRLFHPKKVDGIKAEVEKLIWVGFIYLVPLTDWVSIIIPLMKKHGTIWVCVDYWDVYRACPKDNYSTSFIDHIFYECTRCGIYSFMDVFSGYNKINTLSVDQPKTTFIFPWGTFFYRNLPLGLKNVGATFQCEMDYNFHDIKHTMQPYLDDLPAHSKHWDNHPIHLRVISLRCRHYNIQLNPQKCFLYIGSCRHLGFVI